MLWFLSADYDAFTMAFAPLVTIVWVMLLYLLITGICYAFFGVKNCFQMFSDTQFVISALVMIAIIFAGNLIRDDREFKAELAEAELAEEAANQRIFETIEGIEDYISYPATVSDVDVYDWDETSTAWIEVADGIGDIRYDIYFGELTIDQEITFYYKPGTHEGYLYYDNLYHKLMKIED